MSDVTAVRVSLSESKGPLEPTRYMLGLEEALMPSWGTKCPGCDRIPVEGEQITKLFFTWWHADCGAKHLRESAADEAWLALGFQLERTPSKFSNPETKAIVRNLLRIVGRRTVVPEGVGAERVRGTAEVRRAGLRAIEGGDPR